MANLEFQFNQNDVVNLINNAPAADHLELTMFSTHEAGEPKGEIYFAVQSCDSVTDTPDARFDPAVACPVPPGWKVIPPTPFISHKALENCPRFKLDAASKALLLDNVALDQASGEILLNLVVESKEVRNELEITASIKIKNAQGAVIKTVEAEVK